jgi:DHA1 family tetracycline resistance protein-like MFS transporter
LAIVIVLSGLGQFMLQSIWVLYTDFKFNWGPSEVGLSLAVVGLASVLVQVFLIGRLVGRLGEARALIFGLSMSIVSFVLYAFATQGWMFYAIPFLGALGFIAQPSAQAIITRTVEPNEQGSVQGAITSLFSLTGIAGPLIATNLFSFFIGGGAPFVFPGAPFLLGSVFFLIGILVAARGVPRKSLALSPAKTAPGIEGHQHG